jgi:hypothetical protein
MLRGPIAPTLLRFAAPTLTAYSRKAAPVVYDQAFATDLRGKSTGFRDLNHA